MPSQIPPLERIKNFEEFKMPLSGEEQQIQGARCMECGVPFCQAGMMIGGMASGCPLHNLVPETNDLVYPGQMEAGLRAAVQNPQFSGIYQPCMPGSVRSRLYLQSERKIGDHKG